MEHPVNPTTCESEVGGSPMFKASVVYYGSSRPARAAKQGFVSNKDRFIKN